MKSNKQIKSIISRATSYKWINDWNKGSSTLLKTIEVDGVIVSIYATNLSTVSLDGNGDLIATAKG